MKTNGRENFDVSLTNKQITCLNIDLIAFLEIKCRVMKIDINEKKKSVKQVLYPFKYVNFEQGKFREFLSKCGKMALFASQFSKCSGGACPQTPLEEFRLWRLLCPSPTNILLFHKISENC